MEFACTTYFLVYVYYITVVTYVSIHIYLYICFVYMYFLYTIISYMKRERALARRLEFYISFRELVRAVQLVALSRLQALAYRIKNRQRTLVVMRQLFTIPVIVQSYSIVVFGTDKTCSGAFNNNIFRACRALVSAIEKEKKQISLISISDHACVFIKTEYFSYVSQTYKHMEREPICFPVATYIVEYLLTRSIFERPVRSSTQLRSYVDIYLLLYNRYQNVAVHQVSVYMLPSASIVRQHLCVPKMKAVYLLDVISKATIRTSVLILNLYYYAFALVFLDVLEETEYCELGARATSMETIYNNLKDRIDFVRLLYNQIRQETITKEIIEIVSGILYSRID